MEKNYKKHGNTLISERDSDFQQNTRKARRTLPQNCKTPLKEKPNGIRAIFKNLHFKTKGKQNEPFTPNSNLPSTTDEVRRLIALFKRFDSLYNPNNPQYKRKGADNIYYSEIAQHFPGTTTQEIQEFIKNLRMTFEQEYWIIENARRMYGEVLDPSIDYFHDFLFLVPYMCTQESLSYYYSTAGESQSSTLVNLESIASGHREFLKNVTKLSPPSFVEQSELEDEFASAIESDQQSLKTYMTERKSDAFDKYFPHTAGLKFCKSKKKKLKDEKKKCIYLQDQSQYSESCICHTNTLDQIPEPCRTRLSSQLESCGYGYSDGFSQEQNRCSQKDTEELEDAPSPEQFRPSRKDTVEFDERSQRSETIISCNEPKKHYCKKCKKNGTNSAKGTSNNKQQVEMLCDMIRIELGSVSEDIYCDAKWRIIEVLRDIQKQKLANYQSKCEQTIAVKCQCHTKNRGCGQTEAGKKKCPLCCKRSK